VRAHRLDREQLLPLDLEEVFAFFSKAANLQSITPPWLRFEVLTPEPVRMAPGTLIDYRLRLHGLPVRWLTRIEEWEPNRMFVDRQLRGPYRFWHHRHEFTAVGGGTLVRDLVHYALPLGPLGALAHAALVRRDLERIFDFRQRSVGRILQAT
jgi:ligand-binding SRPBCC domain-containing protein